MATQDGILTRIITTTRIDRPVDEVFAYVTTPGHWPEWHPSSLVVSGATDHSLAIGERVTETFRVAGRTGTAVWTVVERSEPAHWVIDGRIEGSTRGSGGRVTYTLTPRGDATDFAREFTYPRRGLLFRLLDPLLIRPRVRAESAEALRRLRVRLEAGAQAGTSGGQG